MLEFLSRLAAEPPFRVIVRAALRCLPVSIEARARWELSARPAYLLGLLAAAQQAKRERCAAFSAIEFGVAGGNGLLSLQADAAAGGKADGLDVRVFGFDAGPSGLPDGTGDYRDHPDFWRPGDFAMDMDALRARLGSNSTLVVGDVHETVSSFFAEHSPPPVGFVSIDLDLYSSTRDALRIFTLPDTAMLRHVPMYFDDINFWFNHRFAGELLAIEEFNALSGRVKIDRWHGVCDGKPFPERGYFDQMFVAHDLANSGSALAQRATVALPLG